MLSNSKELLLINAIYTHIDFRKEKNQNLVPSISGLINVLDCYQEPC